MAFEYLANNLANNLPEEWLNGLYSFRHMTETRSNEVKLRMGDLGGLTSQLTSSYFGKDVKIGVPCLDAACMVSLNWLLIARNLKTNRKRIESEKNALDSSDIPVPFWKTKQLLSKLAKCLS